MKKILYPLALIFLCQIVQAQLISQPLFEPNKIYLKIKDNSNENLSEYPHTVNTDIGSIMSQYGVNKVERPFAVLKESKFDRTYRITFSNSSQIDDFINDMGAISFVEYTEKIPIYYTQIVPNDPALANGEQYYWDLINADAASDLFNSVSEAIGNSVIAVVDDAVYTVHEDLAANITPVSGHTDVADMDNDPNPPLLGSNTATGYNMNWSHGTHVAGVAGGVTDNGKGIACVGWNNNLLCVKTRPNSTTDNSLPFAIDGVAYAAANGADIINCSFASTNTSQTEYNVIVSAKANGSIIIAAAGNEGGMIPNYPAAYGEGISGQTWDVLDDRLVVSVAALDKNNNRSLWGGTGSCYGRWVDISAYGSEIYSCIAGAILEYDNYLISDGTSMACPQVCAVAGIMQAYSPTSTDDEIIDCLIFSANNDIYDNTLHPWNVFGTLGHGRLDAENALKCLGVPCAQNPEANTSYPLSYACSGDPTTLTVYNGSGYTWSTGATTSSISVTSTGTYDVTVSFPGGCTDIESFTVSQAPQEAEIIITENQGDEFSDGIACGQLPVILTAYWGNSYLWDFVNFTTQSLLQAPGPAPSSIVRSVTVTDVYGCVGITDVATVTVTWNEKPEVLINVDHGSYPFACSGNALTLTANVTGGGSSNYTYVWSTGETTSSIDDYPTEETSYTVVVTVPNGCKESLSHSENVYPNPVLDANVNSSSCIGDMNGSINLTVYGYAPFTYLWSNGETTQNISGLIPGVYSVTVVGSLGCDTWGSYTVTDPLPLEVTNDIINATCNNASDGEITSTAFGGTSPYAYLWSNGLSGSSITSIPAGTYTATITDSNGCISTSSASVSITPDISTPDGILVDGTNDYNPHFENLDGSSQPEHWKGYITAASDPVLVNKDLVNITDTPLSDIASNDPADNDGCKASRVALDVNGNNSYLVNTNKSITLQPATVYMVEARVKLDLSGVTDPSTLTDELEIEMIAEPDLDASFASHPSHGTARSWKLNRIYDLNPVGSNPISDENYITIRKCFTSEAYFSTAYTQNFKNVGFRFYSDDPQRASIGVQVDAVIIRPIIDIPNEVDNDLSDKFVVESISNTQAVYTSTGAPNYVWEYINNINASTFSNADFPNTERQVYYFKQITTAMQGEVPDWNRISKFVYNSGGQQTIEGVLVIEPYTHLEFSGTGNDIVLGTGGRICMSQQGETMVQGGAAMRYAGGKFDLAAKNACIGIFDYGSLTVDAGKNFDVINGFIMVKPNTTITMNNGSKITNRYSGRTMFGGASSTKPGNITINNGELIAGKKGTIKVLQNYTVKITDDSKMTVEKGGLAEISGNGSTLWVTNGAVLHIKRGGVLNVKSGGFLFIEHGGEVIVDDGAELNVEAGALFLVAPQGRITLNNDDPNKGLYLPDVNSLFEIEGIVATADNVDFTVRGNGFAKFLLQSRVELGVGSKFNLTGSGINDKVAEFHNTTLLVENRDVIISNSTVEFGGNGVLFIDNGYVQVNNANLKQSLTGGGGSVPLTVCGLTLNNCTANIHHNTFSGLLTGLTLQNFSASPLVNNNTFTGCETALTVNNFTSANFTFHTLNISGGNTGIFVDNINKATFRDIVQSGSQTGMNINNAKVVTLLRDNISSNNVGVELHQVKGLYLNEGRVHHNAKGFYSDKSLLFLRNGAVIDENTVYGVEMYGSTDLSDALLTLGDVGCGEIINNQGTAIFGKDFILHIDAIEHANYSEFGTPIGINPNRFDNIYNDYDPQYKIIDVCYTYTATSPTEILARGNFWGANNAGTKGVNAIPSLLNAEAGACTNPKPGSNISINTQNFSQCVPTGSCEDCDATLELVGKPIKLSDLFGGGGNGGGPLESPIFEPCEAKVKESWTDKTVGSEFKRANEVFVVDDREQTRIEFVELSKINLEKTSQDKWKACHQEDMVLCGGSSTKGGKPTEEEYISNKCVQLIQVAKILVEHLPQPLARMAAEENSDKMENSGTVEITPNPATNSLQVFYIQNLSQEEDESDLIHQVSLRNLLGQEVYQGTMLGGSLTIDVSQITAKGVYLLEINTGTTIEVRKVILE